MKRLLIFGVCWLNCLFASGQVSEPLAVSAELVGEGTKWAGTDNYLGYFVKLTVKNVSGLKRSFWIFNCSWEGSWQTDGTLALFPVTCTRNFPERISLLPEQQIHFYGFITNGDLRYQNNNSGNAYQQFGTLRNKQIKFAFTERYYNGKPVELEKFYKDAGLTYWSDSVSLDFYYNNYRIDSLRSK